MLIGLVGKPSCGKSTFFKAATLADVLIASYPFATIKPNHGMGYVKVKSLCKELGVKTGIAMALAINISSFILAGILNWILILTIGRWVL